MHYIQVLLNFNKIFFNYWMILRIWKYGVKFTHQHINQGLVKGAILCFRNLYFYFRHGESTSTASQLTSPASQKSKDLNKVLLLLQDLGYSLLKSIKIVALQIMILDSSQTYYPSNPNSSRRLTNNSPGNGSLL